MIFDFLRRAFGSSGDSADGTQTSQHDIVEYQGYKLQARPIKESAGWRVAGVISLEREGVEQRHDFVRADVFSDEAETAKTSLAKAHRIVDEQGERMFRGAD